MTFNKEIEKNKALKELSSLNKSLKKDKRKKLFIFLILFVIFKLTIGSINLYSIFIYPPSKSRLYDVSINKTNILSESFIHHKIPLIPYVLYFNSYFSDTNSIIGDGDITYVNQSSNKVKLSVNSYSCFVKNVQVLCDPKNKKHVMKLNNDTKYTHLFIRKNGRPDKEMYNGAFIDDITKYVSEKGFYYIEISAHYSLFINVTISFNIQTV